MTLQAVTALGPNTLGPLGDMVDHLRSRGHDLEVGDPIVAAEHRYEGIDLLWACGLLTMELMADGLDLVVSLGPVFEGQSAALYHSVIITRADPVGSIRPGRRLAVNDYGSWSGYRGLLHHSAAGGRYQPARSADIVLTGSHVASVNAVARGEADMAAIDSTVWDWLSEREPHLATEVDVVGRTVDWPAPPVSIGPGVDPGLRAGLVSDLLDFAGPPTLVPASPDAYRFMADFSEKA